MNFSFVVFFPFSKRVAHSAHDVGISGSLSAFSMNRKSSIHRREASVHLKKNGDRFEGYPFIYPTFNHLISVLAHCRPARLLHRTWNLAEASQKNEFCAISKRQVGKSILVCTGRHLYGKIHFRTGVNFFFFRKIKITLKLKCFLLGLILL